LSYRELDTARGAFIVPTTTPTQFDPEQLKASIQRIEALAPESVYLTHFSRVTGTARLAQSLREQVDALAKIARRHQSSPQRQARIREDMRALWWALARAHGVANAEARVDEVLGPDLELNTQGLDAWLTRGAR
jgi:glyoxylase-like metal-dependent hydrolase (beta-lactamase superfamily II)